jgi:hypothetical protein
VSDTADQVAEVAAEPQPDTTTEYVEFVGWPPHGAEFIHTHSISKAHMEAVHDIDLGMEEVVWRTGTNGRMLVPSKVFNEETLAYLKTDPAFRIVSL